MNNYTATGISNAVLASRLSYVFNLTGPCMVLDTACSASLVAIHQGCLAVLSGELLGVRLSLIAVHQGCLAILSGELLGVGFSVSYSYTPAQFGRLQRRGVGCGDATINCCTPGLPGPSGELLAVGLSSTTAVFQGCLAINNGGRSHDSCWVWDCHQQLLYSRAVWPSTVVGDLMIAVGCGTVINNCCIPGLFGHQQWWEIS